MSLISDCVECKNLNPLFNVILSSYFFRCFNKYALSIILSDCVFIVGKGFPVDPVVNSIIHFLLVPVLSCHDFLIMFLY